MTNMSKTHLELQANLAEYALGVLDGRTRAEMLNHVTDCAECTQEVEGLATTAQALLRVPVSVDPPIGFESRVMDRIHLERPRSVSVSRLSRVLAAAALLVAFSFSVGWAMRQLTASTTAPVGLASGHIEHGHLTSKGLAVGLVYAYTGHPSWMFVTVDAPNAPAVVKCVLVANDGHRRVVGTFGLLSGKGGWGTRLPVPIQGIRAVQLTSTSGVVVAQFATASWSTASSRGA